MLSWIESLLFLSPTRHWAQYGLVGRHFQLLSTLCQLANKTVDDAVYRFAMRSFVTSNVLTESEFNAQLNTTLKQFIQSLIIQFGLLVNTTQLFTKVDQPYTSFQNAILIVQMMTNATNDQQSPQVHLCLTVKSVLFPLY